MWLFRSLPTSLRARRVRTACSGNHDCAGQLSLLHNLVEVQIAHQGHEDEESTQTSTERSRILIEGTDVRNGGCFDPDSGGTFVIASARQAGKSFLTQKDGQ